MKQIMLFVAVTLAFALPADAQEYKLQNSPVLILL